MQIQGNIMNITREASATINKIERTIEYTMTPIKSYISFFSFKKDMIFPKFPEIIEDESDRLYARSSSVIYQSSMLKNLQYFCVFAT